MMFPVGLINFALMLHSRRRSFSCPFNMGAALAVVCLGACTAHAATTQLSSNTNLDVPPIKTLSLEELGNIEVTTQSKEPEQVWDTAAAISVLTQEDIRRLGATNFAELL